jgi:ABC-type sugar transport system ATPase subunit
MQDILLDVREVSKSFGANKVLDGVSFSVRRGEVVALLGHNGSGKSTLVKILAGAYSRDNGEIGLGRNGDTHLHFIHQTLGLIPTLTVAENLDLGVSHPGLGLMPVRRSAERRRIESMIAKFGVSISPDAPVAALTAAERTIVAIVRALAGWSDGNHVLVLDEPTATLHGEEVNVLKGAVRTLAAQGAGVIYITHRLSEAVELADRALVLKNGVRILEESRGDFDHDLLVRAIAGDDSQARARRAAPPRRAPFLEARGLVSRTLRGVTFYASEGEVLGVSGLVGSGMERVNGAMFGAFPAAGGTVLVDGKPLALGSPRSALRAGVAYVPADRRARASIGHFSARENLTLARMRDLRHAWGGVNRARERDEALAWMTRLRVVPREEIEQAFDLFSGGNQQKIVLAKWLRTRPRVILVDEPTQGVDAGAQAEIHELLVKAAQDGAALVVGSSDTKELAQICDRVLVMREGVVGAELSGGDISESALISAIIDESFEASRDKPVTRPLLGQPAWL